ncbi:MAG: collagen binding domain-containing protein [Enterocloster sp.]
MKSKKWMIPAVQPTTATTDENGTIVIPGLKAGTYEITEISTPKPYILNSTPQRVKLEAGDQKTLMFENIKHPTLIIEKTDYTTNKGIPNTTFKIEHEEDDGAITTVGTFKTDENGRIKLPYVEPWLVYRNRNHSGTGLPETDKPCNTYLFEPWR